LYLALITMLAVGLGAALRYSAGALAILGVLLFLADQFVSYRYLPVAGTDFVRTVHRAGDSPWAGLGILVAWTATSLTLGAIAVLRREL
jgi:ABC-2 type transport system permease protein